MSGGERAHDRARCSQVRNLTTRFRTERGTVTAVDDVSFDVAAGETLAIVGESGSGKSVTALSVLRLIPNRPAGSTAARSCSTATTCSKLDDRRHPRDPRQPDRDDLPGADVVAESGADRRPAGRRADQPAPRHRAGRKALRAATELIGRVRIPDAASRLESYPHQYSGGMRQRVMIAMALACEPRLIIADEPTTALDVTVQAQILDLLKELTRETGSALILITHDLGVVARYADRVAVMYGGRIVEVAPARELYARPQHPYTRGLMASVPRLDGAAGSGWCRSRASRRTSPACRPAARSRRAAASSSSAAAPRARARRGRRPPFEGLLLPMC